MNSEKNQSSPTLLFCARFKRFRRFFFHFQRILPFFFHFLGMLPKRTPYNK